jgi:uncharacterized protein (DUF1015 family)
LSTRAATVSALPCVAGYHAPVPALRAFRALRYDASRVPDLSAVLCPPYDVIDPRLRRELLARDPRNAVRIELPAPLDGAPPGTAGAETGAPTGVPETPYREAARTIAEWRTDGLLVKDREPTVTLHEMRWQRGDGSSASALGAFARLRLEPFGPGAGVRPHERTMSGPKEDRYQLLRATGVNTSPVVVLAEAESGVVERMRAATVVPPARSAVTADGVEHRLWVLPVPGEAGDQVSGTEGPEADARHILGGLAARPVTIADGHHRYETALRYRDERGRNRACESDPAWDYVLALVYPVQLAPSVLPTHRVLIDGPSGEALLRPLEAWFEIEPLPDRSALLERMRSAPEVGAATGTGRLGVLTADRAAILTGRREELSGSFDRALSEASRGLDVNILALALERLLGVAPAELASGGRLAYVKDAAAATGLVEVGEASACFLLDPVPVDAVTRVAAAGEVMPQKSTYFHPKAPTGLLFGPLEW